MDPQARKSKELQNSFCFTGFFSPDTRVDVFYGPLEIRCAVYTAVNGTDRGRTARNWDEPRSWENGRAVNVLSRHVGLPAVPHRSRTDHVQSSEGQTAAWP